MPEGRHLCVRSVGNSHSSSRDRVTLSEHTASLYPVGLDRRGCWDSLPGYLSPAALDIHRLIRVSSHRVVKYCRCENREKGVCCIRQTSGGIIWCCWCGICSDEMCVCVCACVCIRCRAGLTILQVKEKGKGMVVAESVPVVVRCYSASCLLPTKMKLKIETSNAICKTFVNCECI